MYCRLLRFRYSGGEKRTKLKEGQQPISAHLSTASQKGQPMSAQFPVTAGLFLVLIGQLLDLIMALQNSDWGGTDTVHGYADIDQ